MSIRKPPRWVIPFLRGLARTGMARAAAKDAGIDHTTAYERRKAHADFAADWAAALRMHAILKADEEREAVAAIRAGRVASGVEPPHPSPLPAEEREDCREMVISGGQMKRVNAARWNQGAERRFFATLAATSNVTAAADAVGFSTTAIYARRLRHLVFREQWAAVVETVRARLDLAVLEEANAAFERGVAHVAGDRPQVTIQEAIQILKLGGEPRSPTGTSGRRWNARASANDGLASDEEMRAALVKSLKAFGVRVTKEDLQGKEGEGD